MNFDYSDKTLVLRAELERFMDAHVYPNEHVYRRTIQNSDNPRQTPALMSDLRAEAKAAGLWNLFLPDAEHGAGLTNLEYAPLAEVMGRVAWAPQVFNCNAPDTGNMEVLAQYGNAEQQRRWLEPLLAGKIQSGFAMTEPDVASSDATNIQCSVDRDGDDYVINGRKWFTTGAWGERCEILIVMGKTDPGNPDRHRQQSMILVPMDTQGVKVVRPLSVLGYWDEPLGHPEIAFEDVRVPVSNIILGEGRGFEVAQGRLGPGRIHHCMRLIGAAQRALELMCRRAEERTAFGRPLSRNQSVRENIAKSYCEVQQARLLTLQAAAKMDTDGNKVAQDLIAAIKITAPRMARRVIDRSIQIQGGGGLTEDTFLAEAYAGARSLRLADGPDEVHMMTLGRQLIRTHNAAA
jgi:acyl-CoA dehydrogenase